MSLIPAKRKPPEGADAGAWCAAIGCYVEPRHWPAALDEAPTQHRQAVEAYLRSIAGRMRATKAQKPTRGRRG